MLLRPRIFKKLEIARLGFGEFSYNKHVLDQFAYYQWNNSSPFVSGPFMFTEKAPEEYTYWGIAQDIEQSMKYFMKPYNIHVFGENEKDVKQGDLLIRGWLNSTKDINNALVLMERVDIEKNKKDVLEYMYAINNRSWQPKNWSEIEKSNTMTQTLIMNIDNECTTKYSVHMESSHIDLWKSGNILDIQN
jgi:hypothetical protein